MVGIDMRPADPRLGAPQAGTRNTRRSSSTPTKLVFWIALPIVCIVACWAVLTSGFPGLRQGFATIGSQSGPTVEACAHLYYDLADMDGQAANILLIGRETGLGESANAAYKAYEDDLKDANTQLELIGSGIDAIQGGAGAYISIENGLSQYAQDVSEALYIVDQAPTQTAVKPPTSALSAFQAGSALMHQADSGILAQAQKLVSDDQGTVGDTLGSSFGTIGQLRIWGLILLASVLLALIFVQRELGRHFKRRINPLLALSTVFTVIFGILMFSALSSAHGSYVVQKENSLDSVIALWEDQAVSADMNAAESCWLLAFAADPGGATARDEEGQFFTEEQQIAEIPQTSGGDGTYLSQLQKAAATVDPSDPAAAADILPGGYLGSELQNVTFQGEGDAADSALKAYSAYIGDDTHLRSIAGDGQSTTNYAALASAAFFDTGQSNADFTAYAAAITQTININAQYFNSATGQGENGLGPWLWLPTLWAIAMAALIILGFAPRVREYR